jgi:hypothetical protein
MLWTNSYELAFEKMRLKPGVQGRAAGTLPERFKELDRNGDGELMADELPRPGLFKRMDTNGDGVVTLDEAKSAFAGAPPEPAPGNRKPNRNRERIASLLPSTKRSDSHDPDSGNNRSPPTVHHCAGAARFLLSFPLRSPVLS